MKKLDFPINRCTIDITENCNLRCGYCFTYFNSKFKRRDLTYEQGIKTIDWLFKDEISQSNNIDINWWGGEPLFKFDLMKRLTDYALEKSVKERKTLSIGGTTNTTLMNKEVVDWMKQHNSYFMMSIDGPKDIQDSNRPCAVKGCSSWDMIAANLPYAMKTVPFLGSRMSPTPQHIHRMYETFKFLYETYNIESQMYSPVHELEWTKEKLGIAEDQLKMIAHMIVEKRLEGKRFDVKHMDDGARIIESKKSRPEFPCGAGRFYVGISVDGVIYPCHRFNKYDGRPWTEKAYIGTIDDGILKPEFRHHFTNFLEYPIPQKCKDCELYGNFCDLSCYAVAFDLTGDIHTAPDCYCEWTKMQAKVSKYYHKLLKENNLPIPGMGNGGSGNMSSCVCNNMCYLEGTPQQIINVDPNGDGGCICNNTAYSGERSESVARQLTDMERQAILRKMDSGKRIQGGQPGISAEGANLLNQLMSKLEKSDAVNERLITILEKLESKL